MSRRSWQSSFTSSSGRSRCNSAMILTTARGRTFSGRATGSFLMRRSGRSSTAGPTSHASCSRRGRHGGSREGAACTDLAAERVRQQVIFGTEPLLDMMELSGFALLMSELDAPGIWPRCPRAVGPDLLGRHRTGARRAPVGGPVAAREPVRHHARWRRAHRTENGPGPAHERARHYQSRRHAGQAPAPEPEAQSSACSPRGTPALSSRNWPTCSLSSISSSALTWLT